jgi:hypothetical protein
MAKHGVQKDWLDQVSDWLSRNKGLPVFVGVGMVLINLALSLFPFLLEAGGFVGWLAGSDLLLHLGVIIGFVGILIGDAL